jgi:hypothetical protein
VRFLFLDRHYKGFHIVEHGGLEGGFLCDLSVGLDIVIDAGVSTASPSILSVYKRVATLGAETHIAVLLRENEFT